ncbi:MAG: septum formation initiator family protein [Polyangiales bacterium]|nr:septum formation initiator family protein [Myxococcales bacterium]MCB9657770.1 septum formation initiator family protein [Sandaracinaceae bacterium]
MRTPHDETALASCDEDVEEELSSLESEGALDSEQGLSEGSADRLGRRARGDDSERGTRGRRRPRVRATDDALATDPDPAPSRGRRGPRDTTEHAADGAPVDVVLDLRQSLTWLLPFIMLVSAIIAVPARILAEEGLPRYRALQAEQVDLDAQNERMRREVRDLQREVQALRTDPFAIERIARDELGMVRPGEVIFQFNE